MKMDVIDTDTYIKLLERTLDELLKRSIGISYDGPTEFNCRVMKDFDCDEVTGYELKCTLFTDYLSNSDMDRISHINDNRDGLIPEDGWIVVNSAISSERQYVDDDCKLHAEPYINDSGRHLLALDISFIIHKNDLRYIDE